LIVNVKAGGDVFPDSATVTIAVPADAIKLADIVVVNCPALTKFVVCEAPFHVIDVAFVNPPPFTVNKKDEPPANA
jgi:hypothetical protein